MDVIWIFSVLITLMPAIISASDLVTSPTEKVWAQDVNYGNPQHWEGGKIPCSKNRIKFPSYLSVFLQVNTSIREVIFSRDGEIVFGTNSEMAVGSDTYSYDNACEEKDVQFIDPGFSEWYSPYSWKVDKIENTSNPIPIPELERIPCYYETVKFPSNSSFRVSVKGPSILIKTLLFEDEAVNSTEFERLVTTSSGQLQFQKQTSVTIHNNECLRSEGCLCGNEKPEINSFVCDTINCPSINCKDPIKPHGSCCSLCGSKLVMDFNSDFEFNKLGQVLKTFLKKTKYTNVNGYVSKIKTNTVQVVLIDKNEYHKAAVVTDVIKEYIEQDMKNINALGIVSITVQSSRKWVHYYRQGLSTGAVVGIVFLVFILLVVGLTGFAYYRKHNWVNLSFGRLHEESKVYYVKTEDSSDICSFPETPAASRKGFENPMYHVQSKETKEPLFDDAVSEEVRTVEERVNPVFMGFEDLEEA